MRDSGPLHILLVEDNPGDARLIKEALVDLERLEFELHTVNRLAEGLRYVHREKVDLVLLDLSLPDSDWRNTLKVLGTHTLEVPVVVLTGLEDQELATRAVQQGAQDYLVKGEVTGRDLERAMRYAIERQRMLAQLQTLSLTDELTGLYNRRGFTTLAEQQLMLAERSDTPVMVLFVDLDGLKWVNDNLGHGEGDAYLLETAEVLRDTFRASDVVARLGGDEFAVLAIGVSDSEAQNLLERLQDHIEEHNRQSGRQFLLSLSIGTARFDPENPRTVDDLLDEADERMYEEKKRRRRERDNRPGSKPVPGECRT